MSAEAPTLLIQVLNQPAPSQFSSSFLENVPFAEVPPTLEKLKNHYGLAKSALATAEVNIWNVQAERGRYDVLADFNGQGQLVSLRVPSPPPSGWLSRILMALPWFFTLMLGVACVRAWQAGTTLDWLTGALTTVALAAFILSTTVWTQSSTFLRPVWWLGLALLCVSAVRLGGLPLGQVSLGSGLLTLAVTLFLGYGAWQGVQGRRSPSSPPVSVALGPVLSGGTFVAAQAGSTPSINYHVAHPHMKYAVDFLGVGSLGRHARGLYPREPERYAIFGTEVLAPLDGVVEAVRGDLPDQPIPDTDSLRPAGNFVLLRSAAPDGTEIFVVLAHLQQGSVRVQVGQQVRAGQVVGRVGNSGNTTEPHLHLGVNIGVKDGDPLSGQGVPFTVDGRFPVRNMIFEKR